MNTSPTFGAEVRRIDPDQVWANQQDSIRNASVANHQQILDKIKHLRSLRLAKENAERQPSEVAELCRTRADECALLAQRAQGKRRSELLDVADKWDDLAQQNDELAAHTSPGPLNSPALAPA
jgi:hypothetical protein